MLGYVSRGSMSNQAIINPTIAVARPANSLKSNITEFSGSADFFPLREKMI